MKKTIEVFETSDYGIFKRLKGNRDVNNVKRIIKSIKSVGYIMNPVIVNENMEVIDGQNRIEALQMLNLPVHYYVVPGATIDTARALNLGRANWKPIDYAKSYAEEGNVSYQLLLNLMDEAKRIGVNISIAEAAGIMKNEVGKCKNASRTINEGVFEANKREYVRAINNIGCLKKFDSSFEKIEGERRLVVTGLCFCMNVENVDVIRLTNIVKKNYPFIAPVAQAEAFLRDLSMLYNKSLKDRSKMIDFDVIYRHM